MRKKLRYIILSHYRVKTVAVGIYPEVRNLEIEEALDDILGLMEREGWKPL